MVLWILDAFCISSTLGIKAITRLIPIHLHIQKLSRRHQLRTSTLFANYAIKSLPERRHTINSSHHCLFLENMTFKQRLQIKSSIVDANNQLNSIFPLFDSLNSKFAPGPRLVDKFPSYFSFHQADHKNKEAKAVYLCKLNNIAFNASLSSNSIIIISNVSIRNNIVTFIVYIYSYSNSIKITLHYAIGITFSKAELFAVRCSINQAIKFPETSCIIVITDLIYVAH